jgi:NADP-dependent 3-hydroxy acid dehydrogenase YdfG
MTVFVVTDAGTDAASRTARDLLREGHRVVVTDRLATQLVRIVHGYDADHVLAIAADPADQAQMRRVLARAESRFGSVDLVISTGLSSRAGPPQLAVAS